MGYLENMLPRHLARLGADVHVITTDLPPYYGMADTDKTYRGFVKSLQVHRVERYDDFTVHVMGHRHVCGHTWVAGLKSKLIELSPDIVQTTTTLGWFPLQAVAAKPFVRFKLFVGSHYHKSVFPLAQKPLRWWDPKFVGCLTTRALPGKIVSAASEKCYAITPDCAELAVRFFGVSRKKVSVLPLGVDTSIFWPAEDEVSVRDRRLTRERMGFAENEIVCVYSGRFSHDKNPAILAQSIARLRGRGEPYRGLFIGNGVQAGVISALGGNTINPFVPVAQLGELYRACDIAVWPTQESTSMLDAAACGLPIIANDTMQAPERVSGNGMTYRLNNQADLERALLSLRDAATRRRLGWVGCRKMASKFSWQSIARRRLRDYEAALGIRSSNLEKCEPIEELVARVD
jgi:glycosyltransferase involved in cell wall biosynthesis